MILISGPCVIESKDITYRIAEQLANFNEDKNIDFYFKASFDKANRTSLNSFRGPGIDEGLRILEDIKKDFGFKIISDVHTEAQALQASEVLDILQIPAFLCRQTDLIIACAKSDCILNIKKAQFLDANNMKYVIKKALETRGEHELNYEISKKNKVWLCERGSTFGYNTLVVDMRNLVIMREFAPVIFDATHSVQSLGGLDGKSGGDSKYAPYLARAAASVGVDGFFFETHINPGQALSDGINMLDIPTLNKTIKDIVEIRKIIGE